MAKKKPTKKTGVDRKALGQRAQKLVAMHGELQKEWSHTLELIGYPLVGGIDDYFDSFIESWCEGDKDKNMLNPEKLTEWLVYEGQRQEREDTYRQLKEQILPLMVDLDIKELHADGTQKD